MKVFPKSLILDVIYGYEPMTRSLAETLKQLRCEKRLAFEEIPSALDEGFGADFTLGKELCEKAKVFLKDSDPGWNN